MAIARCVLQLAAAVALLVGHVAVIGKQYHQPLPSGTWTRGGASCSRVSSIADDGDSGAAGFDSAAGSKKDFGSSIAAHARLGAPGIDCVNPPEEPKDAMLLL